MRTLLIRNAEILVTMDDARREIRGGGVLCEDNRIVRVGPAEEMPDEADRIEGLGELSAALGLS